MTIAYHSDHKHRDNHEDPENAPHHHSHQHHRRHRRHRRRRHRHHHPPAGSWSQNGTPVSAQTSPSVLLDFQAFGAS